MTTDSSSEPAPQPVAAGNLPGAQAAATRAGASAAGWGSTVLAAILLALLVLVAYAPATQCGYIWDDEAYVTRNPTLRSLRGLGQMWFVPFSLPQYYPLVHSTLWIEYHLWGLKPLGYHVVNVLLHMASVLLFWRLLVRLRVPGAWLAAALLAVHPVMVDSVAWITERKNVLSLALALTALAAYLRFSPANASPRAPDDADSNRYTKPWRWYVIAIGFFIAALLSKTVVASLPAVLLVIYWWKRGRIGWQDVAPLVPFFVVGAVAGLHTVWLEQTDVGAVGPAWSFTPLERLLIAGRAAWFYASKLAAPRPLMFFYPRWEVDAGDPWQWLYPVAALGLLASLWLARGRIGRGPLATVLIFGGVLVPVSGFFNVYPFRYSLVADHFQYHASLAIVALAAAGGALLFKWLSSQARGPARLAAVVLLIVLSVLTVRHVLVYRNLETLYVQTIAHNPDCVIAHANLSLYLHDAGRYREALAEAREAVRLDPREPAAQNDLGLVLLRIGESNGFAPGQLDEAIAHLRECLRLNPDFATAHSNMAVALIVSGKPEEALKHFARYAELDPQTARAPLGMATTLVLLQRRDEATEYFARAAEIEPDLAVAQWGLAQGLIESGRLDAAITPLEAVVAHDANNSEAHYWLAGALAGRGDLPRAARHYTEAVQLQPDQNAARLSLGTVLVALRQTDEAVRTLTEAVARAPQDAAARVALAGALLQKGQPDEAREQLTKAIELDADQAQAHFELANLLVSQDDLPGAVSHYDEVVRLRPDYAAGWQNLGAAELKLDHYEEAISHLSEALRLAPDSPQAQANLQLARKLAAEKKGN